MLFITRLFSSMQNMCIRLVLLGAVLKIVLCADRRITVTESECGRTYNAEDENLYFIYRGEQLTNECVFTIKKYSERYTKICADFDTFRLTSCHMTIEYRSSPTTVKTHSCETNDHQEYCKELEKLTIVFKTNGSSSADEVDLRVYYKEDASTFATVGTIAVLVVMSICLIASVAIYYRKYRQRAKKEKKERKKREKMDKELKEAANV